MLSLSYLHVSSPISFWPLVPGLLYFLPIDLLTCGSTSFKVQPTLLHLSLQSHYSFVLFCFFAIPTIILLLLCHTYLASLPPPPTLSQFNNFLTCKSLSTGKECHITSLNIRTPSLAGSVLSLPHWLSHIF